MAIALVGVGAAYLLSLVENAGVPNPWWLDAPAAFGSATLLIVAFDHWIWRWRFLRWVRLVRTPDFAGQWEGEVRSSFDKHAQIVEVTVTVRQRWTNISVALETGNSRSESRVAAIVTQENGEAELTHTYINQPKSGAVDTMQIHHGTAVMTLTSGGATLEGDYYTGRGRLNEGRISLRRVISP
ncbi:MAG: hypothetical protein IIA90_02600 [Chloroflexi bacterium]|nr:hypothetical protein [Chloroflexota bacterium]